VGAKTSPMASWCCRAPSFSENHQLLGAQIRAQHCLERPTIGIQWPSRANPASDVHKDQQSHIGLKLSSSRWAVNGDQPHAAHPHPSCPFQAKAWRNRQLIVQNDQARSGGALQTQPWDWPGPSSTQCSC
jgi:hypothetical protein